MATGGGQHADVSVVQHITHPGCCPLSALLHNTHCVQKSLKFQKASHALHLQCCTLLKVSIIQALQLMQAQYGGAPTAM